MAGWYYIEQGQQCGPLTDDELRERVAAGTLRPEDYVWTEGMADWVPASQIQGLQWPGSATPPPPPPQHRPAPEFGGTPTGDLNLPRGGLSPVSAQEIERATSAPANVPNYLIPSILSTICCCLPGGIIAIIYSAMASSAQARGDYSTALRHAATAKLWIMISVGFGLVCVVLSFSLN